MAASKIKEVITISMENTYNIEEWTTALVERCTTDNPTNSVEEVAELLGVSYRTVMRICKDKGISVKRSVRKKKFEESL